MRVLKNLVFILCLSAFTCVINAKAECGTYLNPPPKNLYGMIGRTANYTVQSVATNFARHFMNGTTIKPGEIEYVLHYLFNKNILFAEEAKLGIDLVNEYVVSSFEPDIASSEIVLESLIKFRLRLYELKVENFEAHLKDALLMAQDFVKVHPESEKAKFYLDKVKVIVAHFPSNL